MTTKNILSLCVIVSGVTFLVSMAFGFPGQETLAAINGTCIGVRLGERTFGPL